MRCWSRKTFRSIFFHGSAFQSSICCLLLTLLATLATRPELLQYLYLPSDRAYVSISQPLQLGLGFLSHPSRRGIRPGRLLRWIAFAAISESRWRVTPFRVPIFFRDFRTMLYAGFRVEWMSYTKRIVRPWNHSLLGLPPAF